MNKDITEHHIYIRVGDIIEDKLDVIVEKPLSFFNISEWSNSNNTVFIKCHLKRIADNIYSEGLLTTTIDTECDRCLEVIQLKLKTGLTGTYTRESFSSDEAEFELTKADIDLYPITGEKLDLFPLVRDQILLEVPLKSICREDCSGLCPKCGRNKNIDTCSCGDETPHQGMEALKNFKQTLAAQVVTEREIGSKN